MPLRRVQTDFGTTVDDLARQTTGETGAIRRTGSGRDLVMVFRTRKDGRVRPEHAALEGRVWELNDPDAPTPPLAPGCRCEVHIEDRGPAEKAEAVLPAESLAKFKDLEANLAQVYPEDVVAAYRSHLLPGDVIIQRTGDRITTAQARAIIAAHKVNESPRDALKAVAALADRGLSGRVLNGITAEAERRIAEGLTIREAAAAVLKAVERRGTVTARTADAAAGELARARLVKALPDATQREQLNREGMAFDRTGTPPATLAVGKLPRAPVVPAAVEEAERQIAQRSTERSVSWGPDGRRVGSVEGDAASTDAYLVRDGVFTHNHPGQDGADRGRRWYNTLSREDLSAAVSGDLMAARAITRNGLVFQIARPTGGWPWGPLDTTAQRAAAARAASDELKKLADSPAMLEAAARAVDRKEVPATEAFLYRQHLALELLHDLGKIRYEVGRYE